MFNLLNRKISVCILTKNSEETIKRCIEAIKESLNNANITSVEWIIVDGGSTDNTIALVKDLLDNPKILYDGGKGYAYARKMGILAMSKESRYFSFVDSDVTISKHFFKHCIEHLENDSALAAVSSRFELESNSIISKTYRNTKGFKRSGHEYRQYLGTGSVVYKANALRKIADKIDTRLSMAGEDVHINMLLTQEGYKILLDHDLEWSKHIRPPTIKEELKRMWRFGISRALIVKIHPTINKRKKSIIGSIIYVIPVFWIPLLIKHFVKNTSIYFFISFILSLIFFSGMFYGLFKWHILPKIKLFYFCRLYNKLTSQL